MYRENNVEVILRHTYLWYYLCFLSARCFRWMKRIILPHHTIVVRFKNASRENICASASGKCTKTFRNYLAGRNYPSNCRRDRRRLVCRVGGLIFTRAARQPGYENSYQQVVTDLSAGCGSSGRAPENRGKSCYTRYTHTVRVVH